MSRSLRHLELPAGSERAQVVHPAGLHLRWERPVPLAQLPFAPPLWPLGPAHPGTSRGGSPAHLAHLVAAPPTWAAQTLLPWLGPPPPCSPRPLGPAHPGRLRWGRPAHPVAAPPTVVPPTRQPQVGPPGPARSSSWRQAASPQLLAVFRGGAASLTFWRRRRAPALAGTRLWWRPTFQGTSVAPRRSRRPGSGDHEARPHPPALARSAAAAMSKGPEEVNRLTESTYRVSAPGAERPAGAGVRGSRPRKRGGPAGRRSDFFTLWVRRGLYAGIGSPPPPGSGEA